MIQNNYCAHLFKSYIMENIGQYIKANALKDLGIHNTRKVYWNLGPEELMEHSVVNEQGVFADNGALVVDTGEFTGRSPKDRFIVKDDITKDKVWWGKINIPFEEEQFDLLCKRVCKYAEEKDLYVKEVYACSDENYRFNVRLIAELPWSAFFVVF